MSEEVSIKMYVYEELVSDSTLQVHLDSDELKTILEQIESLFIVLNKFRDKEEILETIVNNLKRVYASL